MSPDSFISKLFKTNTAHKENTKLLYLLIATISDVLTFNWAVVAQMRANKELS